METDTVYQSLLGEDQQIRQKHLDRNSENEKDWFKKSNKLIFDQEQSDSQKSKYCKKCHQYYKQTKSSNQHKCINLVQNISEAKEFQVKKLQIKNQKRSSEVLQNSTLNNSPQQVQQLLLNDVTCDRCGQQIHPLLFQTHTLKCNFLNSNCSYCNNQFADIIMNQHLKVCKSKKYAELLEARQQMQILNRQKIKRKLDQLNSYPQQFKPIKNLQKKRPLPQSYLQNMLRQLNQASNLVEEVAVQVKGLSKQEISQIESFKYDKQQEQQQMDQCNVCLIEFQYGDKSIRLVCKHLFHTECIQKWLQFSSLCPVCKLNIAKVK